MFELKVPPLVVVLIVGLGMVLCSRILPVVEIHPLVSIGCGLAFVSLGIYFSVFGVIEFRRNKTTVDPRYPEKASVLVTNGVYSISRNPMYVGFALCLSSLVAFFQSPLLISGVAVFIGYMNRFQIIPEEAALLHHYGEHYVAYKKNVRRWL